MGGENKAIFLLLLSLLSHFQFALTADSINSSFTPSVNNLIDCGSSNESRLDDGRIFKSDSDSSSLLSTNENIQTSVDSLNIKIPSSVPSSSLPLFRSARIFPEESTYTFYISKTGRIWVRLYFFPLPHPSYSLKTAVFSVHTTQIVLLNDFSVTKNDSLVFKEYLLNVSESRLSLKFKPKKNSVAFINAIEVVSAPDSLINDNDRVIQVSSTSGEFKDLNSSALQVSYRVNVGGPTLNDTLSRTWETDSPYNIFPEGSQNVNVSTQNIKYPRSGGASPLIAPESVYATAMEMKDPSVMQPNFNLSWRMNVERYSYLIRLHFCDIVSKNLNQLYFNVYINGMVGVSALDLSSQTKALSTAFYQDFILDASAIRDGSIKIEVGPANLQEEPRDAILNGIEVMKISNSADSLDGFFTVDGKYKGPSSGNRKTIIIVASVGLGLVLTSILVLAVICVRLKKRPESKQKRKGLSSWLLPLSSNETPGSYSRKNSSRKSSRSGSRKSRSSYSGHFALIGIGRFIPFNKLQSATHNFDEKAVIGVGGFGKVYFGTFEDGKKVAMKRGSSNSQQGINEFRTELDLLSNLRHRHLVSLIGYCDERSEMILVYEYMANGPFRSHLYGSNLPPLSWKQRLEICIGAARGLHYLHTGACQSIIHRDVKTTNILLDENFVAKVSDFGLSKAVLDKDYVSTAVKGSFGYLDPEYFMSQQLTQKSDVYSFGVVLFEVLCARPVICPELPKDQVNLADWVLRQQKRGMLHDIIDPRIVETINAGSLKKYVEAAEKCLKEHGVDRPSMGDVLWNLESALQLQESSTESEEPRGKSADLIAFEQSVGIDNRGDHSCALASEASDVTDADSALFSQIANFQGR